MSENTTSESETETEEAEVQTPEAPTGELPADHPLVKSLAAQKATIKELKAKAARLDEIEESQKSEMQKLAERAEAAEKRASAAEFASLRDSVASSKGVPASSLTGTTREELETSADELIAWRDKNTPASKKVTTATSGGGLKSGATANGGAALSPKAVAAERLRQMRAGN